MNDGDDSDEEDTSSEDGISSCRRSSGSSADEDDDDDVDVDMNASDLHALPSGGACTRDTSRHWFVVGRWVA